MRNINSESCKYMKIGNGKLVNFSDEMPDITRGNVKVKYYLTKNLESLEDEFKDNVNVISVDMSKMNTSVLSNISHMLDGCINIESVNLGTLKRDVRREGTFSNINKTNVDVTVAIENDTDNSIAEELTKDFVYEIVNPKDYLITTMPSKDTVITSERVDGKYNFFANQDGIKFPVLVSNWDAYGEYCSEKNPNKPELPYFVNTQHCKDLGVPAEDKFISKNNKNSVVDTPRLCIADNDVLFIEIPEELGIDYFIIHASGHNGAMSEFDYVYGAEDGVYMDSTLIKPASEGTSDIKVVCRDKRDVYKIFNGTLENCKKVWISIDFYKYHELARPEELPEVTHVNPPIPAEAYTTLSAIRYFSSHVKALSGLCLDPVDPETYLYGVSDTYGLYKIEIATGESKLIVETGKDMEGICVGPNNDLYACIENDQQVIRFNKADNYTTYTVVSNADSDKLLATMTEFNNGFEGIAYNPTSGNFYLGNQFKPISVTEYSLENGVVGTPFVLKFDNEIGGTTEVGDMQYDAENNCLWVMDSRSSNFYKYDMEGNNLASYMTGIGSKPNTESLVIDFENNKLYVGCDNKEGDIYIFDFDVHTKQEENPVESITLSEESVTLEVGQTTTLVARVEPDNATYDAIEWSSSNPEVATVENGLVTAVSAGDATIVAKIGEKEASCAAKVNAKQVEPEQPELTISLDKESIEMEVGDTAVLEATVEPDNATYDAIEWSSSNPEVATVENGVVTAVAEGETIIIASVSDDVTASCVVTVKEAESGSSEEGGESLKEVYYGFVQATSNKQKVYSMLTSLTEEQVNENCVNEIIYTLDEPITPFEIINETESKQFVVVKLPKNLTITFTDTDNLVNEQSKKDFDNCLVVAPLSLYAGDHEIFADSESWNSVIISNK